MSRTEEPDQTIQRLLRRYIHVVKDDQSCAAVHVGPEWQDHEILKEYDGQVTVGIESNVESKLSIDGDLRQRLSTVRIGVWSIDKLELSLRGRTMRDKISSEIRRVIREKRLRPNETHYDFAGLGIASDSHKAWHYVQDDEPSPKDSEWVELDEEQYHKLWYNDNDRFQESAQENGNHAFLLTRFRLDVEPNVLKNIRFNFEGFGLSPTGNGIELKIWNSVNAVWEHPVSSSGSSDELLTLELTSGLPEFIDDDGCIFVLAKTVNPSDGLNAALLYCDYVQLAVATNGLTYADIASFRNADLVNVVPFVWHTELIIKTWFFENVPVTMEE